MGALELIGLGVGALTAYQSTRKNKPKDPPPVHTTVAKSDTDEGNSGRKVRKYRPAAQRPDDDLRLGLAGKLGV